jgi:hypothetical protein
MHAKYIIYIHTDLRTSANEHKSTDTDFVHAGTRRLEVGAFETGRMST